MDPIKIYDAVYAANFQNTILFSAIGGIALVAMVLFYRNKALKTNGKMLAMLSFFLFLIALSSAILSWRAYTVLKPVKIYTDHLETSFGAVSFDDILKIEIKNDGGNRPTRLLFIEELKSPKIHVISEKDFEIDSIFQDLKSLIKTGNPL